jgi:hypothetical protein
LFPVFSERDVVFSSVAVEQRNLRFAARVGAVFAYANERRYTDVASKQTDFFVFAFEGEFSVRRVYSCPVTFFKRFQGG